MQDRFRYRIPMFTDKGTFQEFQYIELGEQIECTLCGYNGEPQQSTGLKDKNGKLIYEGDIVKIGNGSVNGSVIETIRIVKWGINSWNVPSWITDKPNFSHYVVVIGNAYENKELLEDK